MDGGWRSDMRGPRPYYVPVANEEQVFKAAFQQRLSILLKGPTGCGKTRFVEAMAHDLAGRLSPWRATTT
ncbi:type II/IV secretion system family protein [Mycobacterium xenopi 3993]|nr:type II/IV secretion system family protein [Mycobacterium xenopi 3993]